VVVKPLIDSKNALASDRDTAPAAAIGDPPAGTVSPTVDSVPKPASRYGTAPTAPTTTHDSDTIASASGAPSSGSGSSRSIATPTTTVSAIETTNTQMSSPYHTETKSGTSIATARYLTTVPTRLRLVRHCTRNVT
jgi:hypothetical protein